jgi:DNA primase
VHGRQRFESFTREQIEEVRQRTDIVALIGTYVNLKSAGKNYLGLCPFHSEKTPSFVVSPHKQNFNCYGCGTHGDAISFIIEIEHYQFVEAVKYLAERSGVHLPTRANQNDYSAQNEIRSCIQNCFDFFRHNLLQTSPDSFIQGYLKQREISSTAVSEFALGYIGEGWDNLHKVLTQKGFSAKVQESLGIIKLGDKGNYYDRLRNRLVFPIRDIQGRVLGFAGRALGGNEAKYLNPPETLLYRKSSSFYGIYEAREKIRRDGEVILVEGYLDVIRLHEQGWHETIAACGTAINEEHVKTLKKYGISKITLLFDGDQAGKNAAEKTAKLFLTRELDSQIVILPEGLDPDDYFKKHSIQEFQKLINEASPDFEFLSKKARDRVDGLGINSQKKVIQELVSLTNEIADPIKKDLFFNKVAELYQIEKETLKRSVRQNQKQPVQEVVRYDNFEVETDFDGNKTEVKLIQYLLNQVKSITKIREFVKPEEFEYQSLAIFYTRLQQLSDEEFLLLTVQDFPELFVEHSTLIMQLLQSGNRIKQSYYDPLHVDKLIYRFKLDKIDRDLHRYGLDPDQKMELEISKRKLRQQFKHLPQSYKKRF